MIKTINERVLLSSILSNSDLWIEFDHEIVKFITDNLGVDSLDITPIRSYSSSVSLLIFKKNNQKFILKVRALDKLLKLGFEAKAFKVLSKKVVVPEIVLYGISSGYEIAIYRHLGYISSDDELSQEKINHIWELILIIQSTLLESSNLFNLNIEDYTNYANEIHRYTLKYVGKDIPLNYLQVLDNNLNAKIFRDSITVFSDRGPVNWVIGNTNITPIDFDLLLIEPRLADFIQFIDHHELNTQCDRDTLISRCLSFLDDKGIHFTTEDFHWHALYRNLIQGAVFYKANSQLSLFHYGKSLLSAKTLNEKCLENEITKILNEVAWV